MSANFRGWPKQPKPRITLVIAAAPPAAADQPQEDPDFFNEAGALDATPIPSGFQATAGAPNASELDWQWDLEQDYLDLTIEAAVASAPVVVNQPPEDIPLELVEQSGEDAVIDLAQATWPVEAQAPPFGDPEDLQFGQEAAFSPVLIPSGFQTTDGAPNPDLVDFHDEEIADELVLESGPVPTPPAPPGDLNQEGWPPEDDAVDLTPIPYGYQNADVAATEPEDFQTQTEWEWDSDTHVTAIPIGYQTDDGEEAPPDSQLFEEPWDFTYPDTFIVIPDVYQTSDSSSAYEHDWDWDSETHITPIPVGYQIFEAVVSPSQLFEEPWDFTSPETVLVVPNVYQQRDGILEQTQHEWLFDELAEEVDQQSQDFSAPQHALTDEPWPWESDLDVVEEGSAPVGEDGEPQEPSLIETAWDFGEQDAPLVIIPDVYQQADGIREGYDEDWLDDAIDSLSAPGIYQQQPGEPSRHDLDPFHWDDTADELTEVTTDSAAIPTTPEIPAITDPWDWDEPLIEPAIFDESGPVGEDGPPPVIDRDLGARWPIYYIHRFRRIRKGVKSLSAAEAIARELDQPAGPTLSGDIARMREELARQGVEWQDQYARILAKERARAERLSRIQREDELAVLLMLDLLS